MADVRDNLPDAGKAPPDQPASVQGMRNWVVPATTGVTLPDSLVIQMCQLTLQLL